jgi:hypothetical protein
LTKDPRRGLANFDSEEQDGLFGALDAEWEAIRHGSARAAVAKVERWNLGFVRLQSEADSLKTAGLWWRGPDDMMGVLRYGRDEVRHCRVLGWILDPIGTHGFGDRVLRGLVNDVAAKAGRDAGLLTIDGATRVRLEEVRDGARADIVVYGSGWCLLVEAKIGDSERHGQLVALAKRWREEDPIRVFLTVGGSQPLWADESEPWIPYRWASVGRLLDDAVTDTTRRPAGPGRSIGLEYIRSFRRHLR